MLFLPLFGFGWCKAYFLSCKKMLQLTIQIPLHMRAFRPHKNQTSFAIEQRNQQQNINQTVFCTYLYCEVSWGSFGEGQVRSCHRRQYVKVCNTFNTLFHSCHVSSKLTCHKDISHIMVNMLEAIDSIPICKLQREILD